jgi:hypothetical protein
MNTPHRVAIALTTLAGVILLTPSAASAGSLSSGELFSQCVRHCAQTMGFSGDHNPGMHQGNAGWDGQSCQE